MIFTVAVCGGTCGLESAAERERWGSVSGEQCQGELIVADVVGLIMLRDLCVRDLRTLTHTWNSAGRLEKRGIIVIVAWFATSRANQRRGSSKLRAGAVGIIKVITSTLCHGVCLQAKGPTVAKSCYTVKWVFAVAVKNRDDALPLNQLSLRVWVQWTVREPNRDTALELGRRWMTHTHTLIHTLQLSQTQISTPLLLLFSLFQIAISCWHTRPKLSKSICVFFPSPFMSVCSSVDLALCFAYFEMSSQTERQTDRQTDSKQKLKQSTSFSPYVGRKTETSRQELTVTGDVILQCERPPGPDPMMQHSGDTVKQVAAGCIQNC